MISTSKLNKSKKHEYYEVLKKTNDDWYPSYKMGDTHFELYVRVYFVEYTNSFGYKVAAWGNDDFGLEKEFSVKERQQAWDLFLELIQMQYIGKDKLKWMGFEHG